MPCGERSKKIEEGELERGVMQTTGDEEGSDSVSKVARLTIANRGEIGLEV